MITYSNLPDWGNDAKRKAWLENYREWEDGLPYTSTPEFYLNWYKCDLPDGSRIVVCEYPSDYGKNGRAALYYRLKTPESILIPKFPQGINECAARLMEINQTAKKGGAY